MPTALSYQGFTGIINTPSAHVSEEGWFHALYTNQEESKWRKEVPFQDNYLFSVGLFNFIELGGRFFEAPGSGRDLSANLKITSAPLTKDYPLLPVIAAGMQDISGGVKFLQTKYLVLSEDIWRLRLSVGYGNGPDRMKGVFAGTEFKAHDWVYLLGEYDTKETNVGARVILPQFWKVPISFTTTAKTSLNYRPGNFEVAVGLSLPLDFRIKKQNTETNNEESGAGIQESELEIQNSKSNIASPVSESKIQNPKSNIASPVSESTVQNPEPKIASLRSRLIEAGFVNVRVGELGGTVLVVEYENVVFNHNELDALGVVAGLAATAGIDEKDGIEDICLIIKRKDIRVLQVSAPLASLRAWLLADGSAPPVDIDSDTSAIDSAHFIEGETNPGWLNTSLILFPGLTTFIGTEFGVFDYLLSIKPDLQIAAWKGAVLNARWDLPVSWSDNLEKDKVFRSSRQQPLMDRLMMFQAIKPLPGVMLNLGAGMILHNKYGILNEAVWSPGEGEHRFRAVQGWNKDSLSHHQSQQMLGAYRYYYAPLDLSLEGMAGKFWAEDKGFSFEMKKFWDDTSVSLYYKDTKGTDHKSWQAAGIQFSFPLTPRRDMKPLAKMQMRGTDEWTYAQETTLQNNNYNSTRGNLNYLAPYPLAINPQPTSALYRSFYNRDRLNAAYIKQNLNRLREAWLKYGDNNLK